MSGNQSILDQINKYKTGYDWAMGANGTKNVHNQGKFAIDCSHLVTSIIQGAGYDVGYQDTKAMLSSGKWGQRQFSINAKHACNY